LPAEQRDGVLPLAVDRERLWVRVERPAVDLDGDFLLRERHVDLVSADRVVRPPALDARFPQEFHQQAFGLRPRAVRSGL